MFTSARGGRQQLRIDSVHPRRGGQPSRFEDSERLNEATLDATDRLL
jgi:hypothetical protein